MTCRLPVVAMLSLLAAGSQAQDYGIDELAAAFGRTVIVIEANEYACYSFDVFIAETDAQKQRGLMFVRDLPEQAGMIFLYTDSGIHSMWMKNTYIPLDIVFIRRDGRISSVAKNTEPLSLHSIRSTEAVLYVLELNAGVTDRLSIGPESLLVLD